MNLRPFHPQDTAELIALFRNTVRTVNQRDYTPEQIAAWAPAEIDAKSWEKRLSNSFTVVATQGAKIIGFANVEREGYIDLLFVHADHQGDGIATHLIEAIESHARTQGLKSLYAHVSITAKPFFTKRGFRLDRRQHPYHRGILFTNHIMEKRLDARPTPTVPTLVIVTGQAASGKTSLAKILARELRLPLFTKDQFKEPLYDHLGLPGKVETHRTYGGLSHALLDLASAELLRASVSHIIEAPFTDEVFTPYLKELRANFPFHVVQLVLSCDGPTLLQRFIDRENRGGTHPGHQGIRFLDSNKDRLLAGRLAPLSIDGPQLEVDTTDFSKMDHAAIVDFVRDAINPKEKAHR